MVAGLMQIEATTFPAPEPNQNILHKAYFVEQICLVLAIQIVLINLLSHVFTFVGNLLPASFLHMRSSSALAVLCATVALFLTETGRPQHLHRMGKILAGLTTLIAAARFWTPAQHAFSRTRQFLNGDQLSSQRVPSASLPLSLSCFWES